MLIKFSENPLKQIFGIIYHSRVRMFWFLLVAGIAFGLEMMHIHYKWWKLDLPVIPVTILGGALAIFLGFRNNSAYDRWWEARKIWGGIVNYSRTFGMMITSFSSSHFSSGRVSSEEVRHWQKEMIYRHIAWLHGLRMHLRKQFDWDKLDDYITKEELEGLKKKANIPTQLIQVQGQRLRDAYEAGLIEDFRHMELANVLKEFYNLQGKAERIKNTVFPYYYNYFTRVFLWLFLLCLPFTLLGQMDKWAMIPMSVAISFVFSILEKSGAVTEDPFEGRAADTPITTIARGIEIDIRQMLDEENVPDPEPVLTGKFGVKYFN